MSKKTKKKNATPRKPGARSPNAGRVASVSKGPLRKAWHITNFRELFELTDDIRKNRPGPLSYTKSQVTLSGLSKEAEIKHFERIRLLKARPERHLLRSVFEDLKNWTGGKHYGPRGYLVTTDGKPASYEYMAAQLEQMNVDDLKRAIPKLAEIGLIERAPFNGSPDGSGPIRTHPDTSGSKHRPLKNGKAKGNSNTKTKGKGKSKSKSKANEQGASKRQSGVTARAKENGNSAKRKANTQEKDQASGQVQSKGQGQEEPPTAPATTPPFKPHESDDLGGSHVIPSTAPQASFNPASGQQRPFVACGYDRGDEVFGKRVYTALGLQWDTESPEGRREICSFASKWAQARARLAGLPPEVVDGLGIRLIKEAGKIARRGKRNKRPGAVMNKVIDKLVMARLREAM